MRRRSRRAGRAGSALSVLGRDPVLLGVIAVCLLLALWFLLVPAGVGARVVVYWVPQPVFDLFLLLVSRRVAAMPDVSPAIRRFWRWLSRAGGMFAVGDSVQTVIAMLHPSVGAASAGAFQTVFVGAGVTMMVVVMLTQPTGVASRERMRLWLDAATVTVGAAVFVWYLNAGSTSDVISTLMMPVVVLVSAFAIVKLMLVRESPFTRGAGVVGSTGVASFGLVMALAPQVSDSRYLGAALFVRLLPSVFIAVSARVQQLQLRLDPTCLSSRRRRPYSLLPYVAVAATQALLVVELAGHQFAVRGWGVVIGVITITVLVVVRQLAAFHDNAALLARLDDSMLQLRHQERRFRSLVQHAADITIIAVADGTVTYASPAIEVTLGIPAAATLGRSVLRLVEPDDIGRVAAVHRELTATDRASLSCQLRARHANGSVRWMEVTLTNLLADPSVGGIVCNARDITEARRLHERLNHQASHDPLTQLANRSLFEERVNCAGSLAGSRGQLAVLMIDLDDFKPVNDQYGHHVGDGLLLEVAGRLSGCVRAPDTVARLGGDEFAMLLPGAGLEQAIGVAQRIVDSLHEVVLVAGHRLRVNASVGVAVGPAAQAQTLLREADAAMYVAKRSGKGSYHCSPLVA